MCEFLESQRKTGERLGGGWRAYPSPSDHTWSGQSRRRWIVFRKRLPWWRVREKDWRELRGSEYRRQFEWIDVGSGEGRQGCLNKNLWGRQSQRRHCRRQWSWARHWQQLKTQWEWKEDKTRGDGHRLRCPAHAGPRRTTESERGLGGGERKGSTFPWLPCCSMWGWKWRCGRGLMSSSSSLTTHCARYGPASADLKVRGCPLLSRLRTGAAKSGRAWEARERQRTKPRQGGGEGGYPDRRGKREGKERGTPADRAEKRDAGTIDAGESRRRGCEDDQDRKREVWMAQTDEKKGDTKRWGDAETNKEWRLTGKRKLIGRRREVRRQRHRG